jgi:hypothetical protein
MHENGEKQYVWTKHHSHEKQVFHCIWRWCVGEGMGRESNRWGFGSQPCHLSAVCRGKVLTSPCLRLPFSEMKDVKALPIVYRWAHEISNTNPAELLAHHKCFRSRALMHA